MPKRVETRISGLGGQGVVLAGEILGRAAVYDGKHAVQTQSYGAEARGSAAKSEVIISEERVGFPKVRRCDVLVAMSQNALNKHLKDLKEAGTLLVDESMVKKIPKIKAKIFKIPATEIAETKLGSRIYANVVMLGGLTRICGMTSEESVVKAILASVPEATKEANLKGFKMGLREGELAESCPSAP